MAAAAAAAAAVPVSAPPRVVPIAPRSKLIPGAEEYSEAVAFLGSEDSDAPLDLQKAQEAFWAEELDRASALAQASSLDASEVFKYANDLPLARIKRIMKSDEDVRMISAEAPVLFAKACELFISDLTIRAYCFTQEDKGKRRTLTREDVCTAVQQTDVFDFLVTVLMPGERERRGERRGERGALQQSRGGLSSPCSTTHFCALTHPPPHPSCPLPLAVPSLLSASLLSLSPSSHQGPSLSMCWMQRRRGRVALARPLEGALAPGSPLPVAALQPLA